MNDTKKLLEVRDLHKAYTFDNSFAPVCNLQTGAFCILSKNFFKKFLKPTSILKCVGLRVYERGHFKLHRFRGSERR